jgi:hypothetical protein
MFTPNGEGWNSNYYKEKVLIFENLVYVQFASGGK